MGGSVIKGPVEALALMVLSTTPAPEWTNAHDWYMLQGILMGAALGAIVADAPIKVRVWRIIASVIFGYMCAGFLIDMFDQNTREGIRIVAGMVAFLGWWVAKAVEMVAPGAARKTARKAADALLNGAASIHLGGGSTDRAADHFAAIRAAQTTQPDSADENQGGN